MIKWIVLFLFNWSKLLIDVLLFYLPDLKKVFSFKLLKLKWKTKYALEKHFKIINVCSGYFSEFSLFIIYIYIYMIGLVR